MLFSFLVLPDRIRNCSVSVETTSTLEIECTPGKDGGAEVFYNLEVFSDTGQSTDNVTSDLPIFRIRHLAPETYYVLLIKATNVKGSSEAYMMKAKTAAVIYDTGKK